MIYLIIRLFSAIQSVKNDKQYITVLKTLAKQDLCC
jgi:hypothetical protein